ncbi:MAG: RnfABCDGE type electron transport complex subunit D [Candidatus Omnitrophica bacterium]|nr:RnfABCDGE type electron transport complex subunit D [Candidatus Omnitrophota bacterium]
MLTLKQTPTPHIRSEDSVPKMMWTEVFALLPFVLASFLFFGFNAFRILVVSTGTALLAEMGMRKLLGKKSTLYDGSTVVTAFLLALILPPSLPSWMVALGSLFAIVFGKEIFGGLGQNPFNPTLVGYAFLSIGFNSLMKHPLESTEGVQTWVFGVTLFLGAIILIFKRLIHGDVSLIYLGTIYLFSLALGQEPNELTFGSTVLLAAFFMVTDPVTTPVTRLGERWFAFGAGLLTLLLREPTGILVMNALTPWLDDRLRPQRSR